MAAVPNDAQVNCLAQSMYYEAGNQSETGKLAVAHVILNRIHRKGLDEDPEAVCKVVKEKSGSRYCQFAWVCNTALQKLSKNANQWAECHRLAVEVLNLRAAGKIEQERPDPTHGAEFFHGTGEHPNWSRYVKTVIIGGHVFYRLAGIRHGRTISGM